MSLPRLFYGPYPSPFAMSTGEYYFRPDSRVWGFFHGLCFPVGVISFYHEQTGHANTRNQPWAKNDRISWMILCIFFSGGCYCWHCSASPSAYQWYNKQICLQNISHCSPYVRCVKAAGLGYWLRSVCFEFRRTNAYCAMRRISANFDGKNSEWTKTITFEKKSFQNSGYMESLQH